MNLRKLDLNLLLVFDAVYTERSITRAANKLGMTQPAVSNALRRLRENLGNALFERVGQGVEPTAEARRLAPKLHDALQVIERTVSLGEDFDPATSTREFTLIMPDALEPVILPTLLGHVLDRAPNIALKLRPLTGINPQEAVLAKTIDIALCVYPIQDDHIRSAFLCVEDTCIAVRADHPVFQNKERFSEEDLFETGFIVLADDLRRMTPISQEIRSIGRSRRIVCTAKSMWSLPHLVAKSDLATVMSRGMADHVAKFLDLKFFEHPINVPDHSWYMTWHQDADDDPAHNWLRSQLRMVFDRK